MATDTLPKILTGDRRPHATRVATSQERAMANSGHEEPPPAALIEAFSKLRQGLTTTFTQEPTLPRTPENERERMAAALVFVAQFIAAEIDRDIANDYFFE